MVFLGLIIMAYWFTQSRKNKMMIIQAMLAFVTAELIGNLVGKSHLDYHLQYYLMLINSSIMQ